MDVCAVQTHLAPALEHLEDADFDTTLGARSWLEQVELVAEEVPFLFHLNVEHGGLAAEEQQVADAVHAGGAAVAVG